MFYEYYHLAFPSPSPTKYVLVSLFGFFLKSNTLLTSLLFYVIYLGPKVDPFASLSSFFLLLLLHSVPNIPLPKSQLEDVAWYVLFIMHIYLYLLY